VNFSGYGADSDGTVVSYAWKFGDGSISNQQNPSHTYDTPGNYKVTLTVSDDSGETGSTSLNISVSSGENNPPTASISANPASGDAPLTVSFEGSGTDSDGTIVSYSWSFGDGASSNDQNPSHTYNIPGTYTAKLTVRDNGTATGTDTVLISVASAPGQQTVIFGDGLGSDYPGTCSDTFVNSGEGGSVNYSNNDQHLKTYTWPANTVANRIVMKWDLSIIPTGALIHNATLSLYMSGYDGTGGDDHYDVSAHKIVNHDPIISASTWNTYDGVNSWTGGFNGGAQDMAPAEDLRSVDKTPGYTSWTITNMVQEWISNPSSNLGLMLSPGEVAASDSNRYFRPTEYAIKDQTPKLIILYSAPGSPPPQVPKNLRILDY
jgi:PKD repeat protein